MSFHTKIVGVTHSNPDGQNRQELIARLNLQSSIKISRDYGNMFDPNAIAVLNEHGKQLGFLNKELATSLALEIDAGKVVTASITSLTGGDKGYTRGVNILIHT